MKVSIDQSAVTRLLVLNGETLELERQLGGVSLHEHLGQGATPGEFSINAVAEYQEEIDKIARLSLTTCWLGESESL